MSVPRSLRPAPGTVCRISEQCVWPERRGLLATVVQTEGVREYPVVGSRSTDTLVFVHDDPFPAARLPNGQPWSCLMSTRWLAPVEGSAP